MTVLLFIVLLVAFDQVTKYAAVVYLKPIVTFPIIDKVFSFTYVENTGAAFGIMAGKRWLFVILTIVILFAIFSYYRTLPKEKPYMYLRFSLILVSAGAVGNFLDRFLNGYVVDFFHFTLINFPVFNVADCFVCVGAFMISFLLLFVIKD